MDKIFLQELADGLAARRGITRKDAEQFIHNVFEIIEEYLLADQLVKVKGLGTFKLVMVDSRESINVNTGERFTIGSHGKVSFTPEKALADRINKPFADFQTAVLNEGTKTEDMERIEEPAPAPVVEPAPAPVVEPEPAPVLESEPAPESVVEPESEPEPVVESEPEPKPATVLKPTDTPPVPPKNRRALWLLLLLLAVLLLWWWLGKKAEPKVQPSKEETPAVLVDKMEVEQAPEPVAVPEPEVSVEEKAAEYPQIENGEWLIVGTKATHTLSKGEDLSQLALQYYGDKRLISYIIRFNHFTSTQASNLFVGAEVKIPELVKRE